MEKMNVTMMVYEGSEFITSTDDPLDVKALVDGSGTNVRVKCCGLTFSPANRYAGLDDHIADHIEKDSKKVMPKKVISKRGFDV